MALLIHLILLICYLTIINAKYYGYNDFYQNTNNYGQQSPDVNPYLSAPYYDKLDKSNAKEVDNWPKKSTLDILGQVSGVAANNDGNIYVFHRSNVVWDQNSFGFNNVYNLKDNKAIANDTILLLDPTEGTILKSWGSNMFYMPHGISIDPQGNIWVTDVALHQVFRFKKDQLTKPDLVLGERFVPGDDDKHFCKPTDIAIASTGVVFISDGYCNSRIMVYSPDGTLIGQFGTADGMVIPHSITLLENEDLLCVADRENRRVLCYTAGLTEGRKAGKLVFNVQHQRLGRVFAVDHIGDTILAVNGPDFGSNLSDGVSLNLATEQLTDIWSPAARFDNPHDITVSADGKSFYVSQISTTSSKKIYKFSI